MTLEDVAMKIELLDDEEIIYCYVEDNKIIASFTTREGVIVEALTPYEIKQVEQGLFTEDDIVRKVFELKQIANFKPE